jgi:hypothetical protein
MSRILAICAAGALLCACQTTTAVKTVCPPLKAYTAEFETALASQLDAIGLSDGDPLIIAMADYGAMRAADRACLSARP